MPRSIAGLQVTSRQPCWGSRTKAFLSAGKWTLFWCKFSRKVSFVFDHQHGHLVTWLQTKNNASVNSSCAHSPPPRANPQALALFLPWVANSRGWGWKKRANAPPPGYRRIRFEREIHNHVEFPDLASVYEQWFLKLYLGKQGENAWNLGNIPLKTSTILSNLWRTSQSVTNCWSFPTKSSTFGSRVRNHVVSKARG